jgi:hypothetical protein
VQNGDLEAAIHRRASRLSAVAVSSNAFYENDEGYMLEVHAPHESVHTWKNFFIHIATITIGLLIAVCLEKTVEYFHHRHQAHEGIAMLLREVQENRKSLDFNSRINEWAERQHRADLGVLQRLRQGALKSGDRLMFVRPYTELMDSQWRVVHESNAGSYIPYELMALYGKLYDSQDNLNKTANEASYELQRAMSTLNMENETMGRDEQNRLQSALGKQDILSMSAEAYDAAMVKLSGDQGLTRLTPVQIDRLEQGFQLAITADRRLNRYYLALAELYADVAAKSP